MTVSKFKIGQSVRLRPSLQTGREPGGEYRIVQQLTESDGIIRYRVRSSADEKEEVVVKESELCDLQTSKVRAPRSSRRASV
jgi:hypothetical protein